MSIIKPTIAEVYSHGVVSSWVVTWAALTEAPDYGEPFAAPGFGDRLIQLLGTFDTSTVAIQGSLVGTVASPGVHAIEPSANDDDWANVPDAFDGSGIAPTAAGFYHIPIAPLWIRPKVSGGATTSITIRMLVRQTVAGARFPS